MTETKTAETTLQIAYKEALATAKTIEETMGKEFFTLDQMRKKMTPLNNGRHIKTMGGGEARKFIIPLISFGMVEVLQAVNDCYKIRLDKDFQISYLKNQIAIRENEIAALIDLGDIIIGVKKVDLKKDSKKTSIPESRSKAVKAAKKKQ